MFPLGVCSLYHVFITTPQGILLFDQSEKLDSMNLLMYMSPIASLALVPMTYVFERDAIDVTIVKAGDASGTACCYSTCMVARK